MEIVNNLYDQIKDGKENTLEQRIEVAVLEIHDEPVMELVLDCLSILGKHKEIAIKASGKSISNAVTVALIITEKFMNRNSRIFKITVDSNPIREMGGIQSTIEIILKKI